MQLLTIRYFQIKRDLGLLFFAIVFLMAIVSYFIFDNEKQIGGYYTLFILYVLYNFHANRKDKTFMSRHFDNDKKQLIIEYQLTLLPLALPSVFTHQWYYFFVIQFSSLLLLLFNFNNVDVTIKSFFLHKLFKQNFIIISGLRRNLIPFILFMLLSIVLSPLKLFPLVALFFANQMLCNFFSTNEGIQLLKANQQSTSMFLNNIFKKQLVLLVLLNAPVLIINSLFNNDLLLFNSFYLGYNCLMLTVVICIKYESYNPKQQENNFQFRQLLLIFGLFMPFLAIITVLYFFQSRNLAIKNLQFYLDDNHQ